MATKSKRRKMQDRLDELCRDIVRLRDDDRCQKCNKYIKGSNSHPCHVIAKGKGASWRRFDLLNIFLGCIYCHRWWHNNPVDAYMWFARKFPARLPYLHGRYGGGKPAKIASAEMEALIVEYKKKRKDLQGG